MAKILTFRTAERRDDESACEGASAQVIVFPGVRYEHWEQSGEASGAAAPATAKPSHDRRRDVLELAE
jgi:hypothetical protein